MDWSAPASVGIYLVQGPWEIERVRGREEEVGREGGREREVGLEEGREGDIGRVNQVGSEGERLR